MSYNILDIYNRLYNASDNIKGETIDYSRGFQDAVYCLKLALEKYEHINIHIENKKLKRQLLITDLNFDDSMFTISSLRKEIKELKAQIKKQNKAHIDIPSDMKLCQIEIADFSFDFYSIITQDELNEHIPAISDYIGGILRKSRRNGQPKNKTDYKAWVMQYLRNKGYKCVA